MRKIKKNNKNTPVSRKGALKALGAAGIALFASGIASEPSHAAAALDVFTKPTTVQMETQNVPSQPPPPVNYTLASETPKPEVLSAEGDGKQTPKGISLGNSVLLEDEGVGYVIDQDPTNTTAKSCISIIPDIGQTDVMHFADEGKVQHLKITKDSAQAREYSPEGSVRVKLTHKEQIAYINMATELREGVEALPKGGVGAGEPVGKIAHNSDKLFSRAAATFDRSDRVTEKMGREKGSEDLAIYAAEKEMEKEMGVNRVVHPELDRMEKQDVKGMMDRMLFGDKKAAQQLKGYMQELTGVATEFANKVAIEEQRAGSDVIEEFDKDEEASSCADENPQLQVADIMATQNGRQ
ncbi:MAG: hypothetical protein GY804_13655 [Alphaproteobacteria bacterium]|nr:hypothetical protein [Alphaproteobacteria bacterium]